MSEQSTLPDEAAPAPEAGAYRVLARTWRPKRFADLIGQDALVRTLTNAFAMFSCANVQEGEFSLPN